MQHKHGTRESQQWEAGNGASATMTATTRRESLLQGERRRGGRELGVRWNRGAYRRGDAGIRRAQEWGSGASAVVKEMATRREALARAAAEAKDGAKERRPQSGGAGFKRNGQQQCDAVIARARQ